MLVEIFMCLLTLFLFVYWYITKEWGYFKKCGIPECTPSFPIGSQFAWDMFLQKIPFTELQTEATNQFPDEKMYGGYLLGSRLLVIKDLELAKQVCIKDFDHFTDRGLFSFDQFSESTTEEAKSIKLWLLSLKGEEWKQMRTIVSPVFTSGKLRLMSRHITKVRVTLFC